MARWMRRILLGLIAPALVVMVWHALASRAGEIVFPPLGAVWDVVAHPAAEPNVIDAPSLGFSALTSVLRVLIGFALAAVLAVPLGVVMGRVRAVHELLAPGFTMLRVVCPIAWLPVAIVLIGDVSVSRVVWGEADAWKHEVLHHVQLAMIAIIALGAFFPVLLAAAGGARAVRTALLESAGLMGASAWQTFWHVTLPHALPSIVNGMRVGLGIAWMVIVAAELYPGTLSGLGYTIWVSHEAAQYEYAFAAILYIMGIGVVANGILYAVEIRVGHWQAEQR